MSWRCALVSLLLLCSACLGPRDEGPPQRELDHLDGLVLGERISALLLRTSASDFADVEVALVEGVVVLEGTVPSRQARELAGDLTRSVEGVPQVENRLVVAPARQPASEPEED